MFMVHERMFAIPVQSIVRAEEAIPQPGTRSSSHYDEWPPLRVRLRGLPWYYSGWNAMFYKTDDMSEDCPVYRMDSYAYLPFLYIKGVKIWKRNGKWIMTPDGQRWDNELGIQSHHDGYTPLGEWVYNNYVLACTTVEK